MNFREWALPVYTILMQLATGALFVLWTIRSRYIKTVDSVSMDKILRKPVMVIFFTILVAIIGAHFHLSNPIRSFLAVLNFRESWLSREIIFSVLMLLTCAVLLDLIPKPNVEHQRLIMALGWMATFLGSASIFCMGNIYLLPTQAFWNNWTTILLFFGSSLLLGVTAAAALLVMDAIFTQDIEPQLIDDRLSILNHSIGKMAVMASVVLILITVLNGIQIYLAGSGDQLAKISLTLLLELYRPLFVLRFVMLFAGVGIFITAALWLLKKRKPLSEIATPIYLACFLTLVTEILGRVLFYATHVRMGL